MRLSDTLVVPLAEKLAEAVNDGESVRVGDGEIVGDGVHGTMMSEALGDE